MTGRIYKLFYLAFVTVQLAACSPFSDNAPRSTLAQLPSAVIPEDHLVEIPALNLDQLQASYERALQSSQNPELSHLIRLRLADIEMRRAETRQAESDSADQQYQQAVAQYQTLLNESRQLNTDNQDYLHYQLAKAHALDGELDESITALSAIAGDDPDSPFVIEALFRRAERSFTRRNYPAASRDYQAVIDHGQSPFYQNAHYMLGWSEFKQARYHQAVNAFTQVLFQLAELKPLALLEGSDKNLGADTLRVLSLSFSYLGGSYALAEFFDQQDAQQGDKVLASEGANINRDGIRSAKADFKPELEPDFYRALGELYLDKERYRDSADTYQAFVKRQPFSSLAPEFSVAAIESLKLGKFPSEILPAKKQFVTHFGINSDYWQAVDDTDKDFVHKTLHEYLQELASYEHARAQTLSKKSDSKSRRTRQSAYLAAADYYREFSLTFPNDNQTPRMVYLMAEALEAAGQYRNAFIAYEQVAYDYIDSTAFSTNTLSSNYGADAGYSAILTSQKVIDELTKKLANTKDSQLRLEQDKQRHLWKNYRINSAINFTDYYSQDPRALNVLVKASEELYTSARLPEAVTAASRILDWQPPANNKQRKSAYLVLGHSQFDLGFYAQAEPAYNQALALSSDTTTASYANIAERLAASIYKQGELAQLGGDTEQAVDHLLRIRGLNFQNPKVTELAARGQFDAIGFLMELTHYPRAYEELLDYRKRYPSHPLTIELTAKAIIILEALDKPYDAAEELTRLAKTSEDPQVQQQSLFLAAESYQKAEATNKAIDRYRSYANRYKYAHPELLEAQFQLAGLYRQTGDSKRRNFWLGKLEDYSIKSDRGLYLAAWASSELAEQEYQRFAGIKLSLPLKKSLKKKKRALNNTVDAYERTLDLGVEEFTSQASFRLGEIYAQLSRDLMDSQRPNNLNALELEQYEILLEEQAYPFEEKAIEIHETNTRRSLTGLFDGGVKSSYESLKNLLPARYNKPEQVLEFSDVIH